MRLLRQAGLALRILAVLIALGLIWPAMAGSGAIEPFLGQYEGRTIVKGDGEATTRDLDVTIEPVAERSDRFRITWSTIVRRSGGEPKRKSYSIAFMPTGRPGIYASAMRTDLFGNAVPLDPLKGDPFVWCRIAGKTLTVYALTITDNGGYDLQVYDRTLRDGGIDLTFTRLDEGEPPTVVTAVLEKTKP
jgi:hypothetical protein